MAGIGIRFPFRATKNGGVFLATKTTAENIKSQLFSLLTTKKGHRVMRQRVYSPLYDFIWEPMDEVTAHRLEHELEEKISEFIPDITIDHIDVELVYEENLLKVSVVYTIDLAGDIGDVATVFIPREEIDH